VGITLQTYWNNRFEAGDIWGTEATPSAVMAYPYFAADQAKRLFVPGCGYGRNSNFFGEYAFHVTACDISEVAIERASNHAKAVGLSNVKHFVGDYLNLPFPSTERFDGIYLSNILHMYTGEERENLFHHFTSHLRKNGLLIFSCLSARDEKYYGAGVELEKDTFLVENRIMHFFHENELQEMLQDDYQIVEMTLHNQRIDFERGAEKDVQSWFVVARKK
jgi:SAM-dependent methyltransferase